MFPNTVVISCGCFDVVNCEARILRYSLQETQISELLERIGLRNKYLEEERKAAQNIENKINRPDLGMI